MNTTKDILLNRNQLQQVMRFVSLFSIFLFFFLSKSSAIPPEAIIEFKRSSTCIKAGGAVPVEFYGDKSKGNGSPIVEYIWNFGNGSPSVTRSKPDTVSTVYLNPGVYRVTLTVRTLSNEIDNDEEVVVIFPEPIVSFSSDVNSGCIPLDVNFTDLTNDLQVTDPITGIVYKENISSRFWTFGDGTTETSVTSNIIHKYDKPGQKDVGLVVTSSGGCKVIKAPSKAFITIFDPTDADFYLPPPSTCQFPLAVQAVNNSNGAATYKWSGTGPSSIGISDAAVSEPLLTFSLPGTYTVRLVTATSNGCVDSTEINYFVPPTSITASFTGAKVACAKTTLSFINTSNPAPISNKWFINGVQTGSNKDFSYFFNAAGTYNVKLETQIGGCIARDSIDVEISPLPVPDFTFSNTASCTAPFSVDFFDNSSGSIVRKVWEFGDGNSKTETPPFATTVSNIYNKDGQFSVRLTVTSDKGCSDNKLQQNLIKIVPPKILKKNLPDSGCLPFTIAPDIQFENPSQIATWDWEYTDRSNNVISTSSGPTPSSYFLNNSSDSGRYTIKLKVTNLNGCVTPFNWIVRAGNKPKTFDFDASPQDDCASKSFTFNYRQLSQDSITGYKWVFNSTDTVPGKTVKKDFKKLGPVNVDLLVYQYGCSNILSKPNFVNVKGVVSIFSVLDECVAPLDRVVVDNSIGNIQNWIVNYGDGNTQSYSSKQTSIRHTYAQSGKYTISLKVSDGTCDYIDSTVVNVLDSKVDFQFGKLPLCVSDTFMNLTALVDNPLFVKSYSWDLGCGFSGPGGNKNLKVNFSSLCKYSNNSNRGLYSIQLRIVDTNNCVVTSPIKTVLVGGPIAKISAISAVTGCYNLPVNFKDNTTGDGTNPIVSKFWSFGDGTPQRNILSGPVSHVFSGVGQFPATLTVTDNAGCQSYSDTVTVVTSDPDIDLISFDLFSCFNKNIQFESRSTATIVDYKWDFGDGILDSRKNPRISYNKIGVKTVKLTIKDLLGCQKSVTKSNYIYIDMPNANFTAIKDNSDCPPFNAEFTFNGNYAESFEWDFGDGVTSSLKDPNHLYLESGAYPVNLKVTSPGGCVATSASPIMIKVNGPKGSVSFKPAVCDPYIAQFNISQVNSNFVLIDYGDGNLSDTLPIAPTFTYKYPDTGFYQPNVFLLNTFGCNVFLRPPNGIKAVAVEPKFTPDINFMCDKGAVAFTDRTFGNESISAWKWDFGDGKTGTGANPVHFYDQPGIYSVKMNVITQSGCIDSLTRSSIIEVQARPDLGIQSSKASICEEDIIQFTGIEVTPNNSPVVSWFWDFTNGNSATGKSPPPQQFRKAGSYPFRLYATNSKGCSDTLVQNFVVNANPIVDAGADTVVCFGKPFQLSPKGASTYQWDPVTGISCLNCTTPSLDPSSDVVISVKGTSAQGCSFRDSFSVKVLQPTKVSSMTDTFICDGESVRLRASGTQLYSWAPAASLSKSDVPAPLAKPAVTTTYTVTGKDTLGCFTTTSSFVVKVIPNPKVDAGNDTTVKAGYPFNLNATYSGDVSTVRWEPSLFLNCITCKTPVITPSYSATYTLFAYTPEGCMSKDVKNVFVTCTKENLYIPNLFSPNGDGINEYFFPRGRGIEKIKSMKLFSRWGQLVYEKQNFFANDQSAGWDGRKGGQFVTPDVYVYMIELVCENGNIITLKGDVTLVR